MHLKVPGKGAVNIELFRSKPPKPEDIAIVAPKFLSCSRRIGEALRGIQDLWAIGGEAGLVLHGVPVDPDRLEIVTTRSGADEILAVFSEHMTLTPGVREVRLSREAEVGDERYPVTVRSYYGELDFDGVDVEVHGDKQFKVGDWDWGDPLEFSPEVTQVMGVGVNLVPLRLESEFAIGLGWLDLSIKIGETMERRHHRGM